MIRFWKSNPWEGLRIPKYFQVIHPQCFTNSPKHYGKTRNFPFLRGISWNFFETFWDCQVSCSLPSVSEGLDSTQSFATGLQFVNQRTPAARDDFNRRLYTPEVLLCFTNSSPLKNCRFKRKVVCQPPFFWGVCQDAILTRTGYSPRLHPGFGV